MLFNGCRSGEIFSIDLRQRERGRSYSWQTSRFFQESSITSLRLLQDENYLLAADMLGQVCLQLTNDYRNLIWQINNILNFSCVLHQIKLWDIRVKQCVKCYEGHNNKYAFLPIHVNEPEDLLLAGTSFSRKPYTNLFSFYIVLIPERSVCCLQLVRTATPGSGVSVTVIFSGRYLHPTPRGKTRSQMWCFPPSWVVAKDHLDSLWLFAMICITTLTTKTMRMGCLLGVSGSCKNLYFG